MKMKKFLAVMAVVSMTAAMAAGCGSSEEEGKIETNEKTTRTQRKIWIFHHESHEKSPFANCNTPV